MVEWRVIIWLLLPLQELQKNYQISSIATVFFAKFACIMLLNFQKIWQPWTELVWGYELKTPLQSFLKNKSADFRVSNLIHLLQLLNLLYYFQHHRIFSFPFAPLMLKKPQKPFALNRQNWRFFRGFSKSAAQGIYVHE